MWLNRDEMELMVAVVQKKRFFLILGWPTPPTWNLCHTKLFKCLEKFFGYTQSFCSTIGSCILAKIWAQILQKLKRYRFHFNDIFDVQCFWPYISLFISPSDCCVQNGQKGLSSIPPYHNILYYFSLKQSQACQLTTWAALLESLAMLIFKDFVQALLLVPIKIMWSEGSSTMH